MTVAAKKHLERLANNVLRVRKSPSPTAGGFLRAVVNKDFDSIDKMYSPVEKAAMSGTSGLVGGYIIPQEISHQLFRVVAERSFIRPRATIIPMQSDEVLVPSINETTQAALRSPFFGGMNFFWGQGADDVTLAQNEPTFKQSSLVARDLIGQLVVSNQLIMDMGPSSELAMIEMFGAAIAWYEELAFLRGTGVANSQPLGMLNAPAALPTTRSSGSHIAAVDIALMASKLIPYSWNQAVWACSPSCLADICKLSIFIINESPVGHDGMVGSLLCHPLFVTEKLPIMGVGGDLMLFDPSLYAIGDRQQVIIDSSPHPLLTTNQTVFRVWSRVDGKPLLDGTITLADATSAASSIVYLAT